MLLIVVRNRYGYCRQCYLRFISNIVVHLANIALGRLITKATVNGWMPFECITKLYDALAMSIITYGSAICGFKNYSYINNVHKRACKYFLGFGRYTLNVAVYGGMGWKPPFQ